MPEADPYDLLPYTDHAYAESHPDRLAVVAMLSGWRPPDVETARILELGCGRGRNLLPMASALPGAKLLGIDRSRRQIDEARAAAEAAGLDHVRFEQGTVESLEVEGKFEFVVCHGLCSWVPPATRRALLAGIARVLAPGAVAYVSFNVLPGWYERLAARDWLRAFPVDDPQTSLNWLRDAVSPELADYRRRLDAVARRLSETDPAYATHEYLADEHHPQRVGEMLAEADAAGLTYLGDAIPGETALEVMPDAVGDRARGLDPVRTQQLVDFVRCAAFRRALLVRTTDAAERGWSWPSRLESKAIGGLRIASRLRPHEGTRFDGPDTSVQVADADVRHALHELARVAPRSLAFDELTRCVGTVDAGKLQSELLDLWLATGAIDLHTHEPSMGDATSPRPEACSLVRSRAADGGTLTNRWHQEVRVDDPVLRHVLGLLDGLHTAGDVATALGSLAGSGALSADERLLLARASIESLASCALLVR